MQLLVKATDHQKKEFLSKPIPESIVINWFENNITEADAYFDLSCEENISVFCIVKNKSIFVNTVITTCKELPENCIRINAWNDFLKREIVEIALHHSQKNSAEKILNELQWTFTIAADEPGMISARIIAMIINEAYFALEGNISSKEEIDTAMKLGTNYPYGPFEWSEKIGLHRIYRLLKKLSEEDNRYQPATLLEQELKFIA
jgi:3-hydroxybutyryl-CoA dehydrogenase